MVYMVTFTINIPQMLVYMPYMDPMGVKTISVRGAFFAAPLRRHFGRHERRLASRRSRMRCCRGKFAGNPS